MSHDKRVLCHSALYNVHYFSQCELPCTTCKKSEVHEFREAYWHYLFLSLNNFNEIQQNMHIILILNMRIFKKIFEYPFLYIDRIS